MCENSFKTLFSEVYKITLQVSFVFVFVCVMFLLMSLLLPKDNDDDFNINYVYEFLLTILQTHVTWGEQTAMFIYILWMAMNQKYLSDV